MLKNKRQEIIQYVRDHRKFLSTNAESLDIYNGNLLPYVDKILSSTLSENYYKAIRHRIVPINILQRFIDKVSTAYSQSPERTSEQNIAQEFVEFYKEALNIDVSGQVADCYSNLFKGFAWEPYIGADGKPKIRELSYDKFLVMSDSSVDPEEETIFIKFMGYKSSDEDSLLMFVYTDTEFDAFYMNGAEASEYLVENNGVNLIGVIPFVYGKRQRNRLVPVPDSDILSITKAIPTMLTDAAGAQMFQCFTILYGIDVDAENITMSPNSFWSIKSDKNSDKNPQIGSVKPEADTNKVVEFVTTIFVLWLETKGIRIGSIGNINAGNAASGIAKIIDEMDVYEIKRRSMQYFKQDEEELWNIKLPAIHNHWIKTGQIKGGPGLIPENFDMGVKVTFKFPEPMITRKEEVENVQLEVDLGTMTLDQAIRKLHPEYSDEEVAETLNGRLLAYGMDQNQNTGAKES